MRPALRLVAPWLCLLALACGDGGSALDASAVDARVGDAAGDATLADAAEDAGLDDAASEDAASGEDAEAVDAEGADAEAADAEGVDASAADAEAVDAADAGSLDAEGVDAAADAALADAHALDAEPADAEPSDAGAAADAEIDLDAEPALDADTPDVGFADAALADATEPADAMVFPDATVFPDAMVFADASAPDATVFPDASAPDATVFPDAGPPPNSAPVVGVITGLASASSGDARTYSITASDPDGDPLVITWSDGTGGTTNFPSGRTAASTTWMAPIVGASTPYTLEVTVSDGQAIVVQSLTVTVAVPTYTSVQSIFDATCTGCHGASGGLSLQAGVSYNNLINITANACAPRRRVVPGDPDNSALVQKMEGSACGSRMPRSNPTYFDNNPGLVRRVRAWILGGALN